MTEGRPRYCSSIPTTTSSSEGGKIWPRVKEVAEEVGLIANLKAVDQAVRRRRNPDLRRSTPALGARRLRMLVPSQSDPACHHEAPFLRTRRVGRRLASRFRAKAGRYCREGALGAKRLRQY